MDRSAAGVRSAIAAGDYAEAVQRAQSWLRGHPRDAESWFELARAEALRGNNGNAQEALDKAVGTGLANARIALDDPAFTALRTTERFAALVERAAPAPPAAPGASPPARRAAARGSAELSAGDAATHVSIREQGGHSVIRAGDVTLDTDF